VSGVKGVGGLIHSYDKEFRQIFRYWNDEFARKIQTLFLDPHQYIRANFKESWDKQISYIMFMLHFLQVNNEHLLQVRLFVMTGKCYIESRIRFKIDLWIGQDGSWLLQQYHHWWWIPVTCISKWKNKGDRHLLWENQACLRLSTSHQRQITTRYWIMTCNW
jgi:hypothetical protein